MLHKPPFSYQALHVLEDITVLVVPDWQRELLFQTASGKPSAYAIKVFKCTVTEQHIYKCSGLVSYRGSPGKYALPKQRLPSWSSYCRKHLQLPAPGIGSKFMKGSNRTLRWLSHNLISPHSFLYSLLGVHANTPFLHLANFWTEFKPQSYLGVMALSSMECMDYMEQRATTIEPLSPLLLPLAPYS